jgi:hypothetical protein
MWSTHRLPFEPKGALLAARNQLRIGLQNLAARFDSILEAKYVSLCRDFVDTENVLIYNVGPAAFCLAARFGLTFQRDYAAVPAAPAKDQPWLHYHSYALVPSQALFDLAVPAQIRIQLRLRHWRANLKPHEYWWATKRGTVSCTGKINEFTAPFKMAATITGPTAIKNCAAALKPLFDGIISGFHYDSTIRPSDTVSKLIATQLGVTPNQVAMFLCEPANCFLGQRKVVAPFRGFIKWNPADERCELGQLLVKTHDARDWKIDVDIGPTQGPVAVGSL